MMRLLQAIPLDLLLLAQSVQAGALVHSEGGCSMSCCAEFAAEDGCFCEAAEPPVAPAPALPVQVVRDLLLVAIWRGEMPVHLPFNGEPEAAQSARLVGPVPHFPDVGLPVLFCSFLI